MLALEMHSSFSVLKFHFECMLPVIRIINRTSYSSIYYEAIQSIKNGIDVHIVSVCTTRIIVWKLKIDFYYYDVASLALHLLL